jgi:hypothetical protein
MEKAMKPKFKMAGEGQDSWIVDQHGRDIITIIKMGDSADETLLDTLMPLICDVLNRREVNIQNPLHEIIFQMRQHGGAFVKSLTRPLELADPENQAALIHAFPEIMTRYDDFATMANREKEARIEWNSLDSKACKDG